MALPKHEYRVVCSGAGQHVHRRHVYEKPTEAKALQAVIDADHHAEMHPGHYVAKCAPWSIERRLVGKWEAPTTED